MASGFSKEIFYFTLNELPLPGQIGLGMPADSPELLCCVYHEKIASLEKQLNKLNLLEHPCEIQFVCQQIAHLKRKSLTLARKHKLPE